MAVLLVALCFANRANAQQLAAVTCARAKFQEPSSQPVACQINFYVSGTCPGMASFQAPLGAPFPQPVNLPNISAPASGIIPWEAASISITQVRFALVSISFAKPGTDSLWGWVGNSYQPDMMVLFSGLTAPATVEDDASHWGFAYQFPSMSDPTHGGTNSHIDLHMQCSSGTYTGQLSISYRLNPR